MDQPDGNHSTLDFQQNMILEMMKDHGLSFQYHTNYMDPILPSNREGEVSLNIEHEQDENDQMPIPVVYKKRARIKFTQEQLDVLEATFEEHRYPTIDIVDDLVEQLNIPTQKITVWFQNRRARLKKNQQKLDEHPLFEQDNQQQYDSGIHLHEFSLQDEDLSRASSISPSSSISPHVPPASYIPPTPSPYYLPNPHQTFYNPMWQNFRYPFPPPLPPATNSSYDFAHYQPPFVFHDMNNYQHHL